MPPDEITNGNGAVEDDDETPGDLSGLFDDVPEEEEVVAEPTTTDTAKTPPAATVPDPKVTVELQTLKERQAQHDRYIMELKTENEILRQKQSQAPKTAPTPADEDEEEAALNKELGINPAKVLLRLKKELREQGSTEASRVTDEKVAFERAVNADRTKALNKFGAVIDTNPDIMERANQIYQRDMQGEYRPGTLYTCIAAAYSELSMEGKLVKPKERRPTPPTPEIGPDGRTKVVPTDDVFAGYGADELKRVRQTMKQLGVTEDEWKARAKQLKKSDSRFGEI